MILWYKIVKMSEWLLWYIVLVTICVIIVDGRSRNKVYTKLNELEPDVDEINASTKEDQVRLFTIC